MNNIFSLIEEKDLTDDLRLIADELGIEAVRKMLLHFGGLTFYIPKITRLDGFLRRYIKQNSKKSVKALAREINVSDTFVRSLLKSK